MLNSKLVACIFWVSLQAFGLPALGQIEKSKAISLIYEDSSQVHTDSTWKDPDIAFRRSMLNTFIPIGLSAFMLQFDSDLSGGSAVLMFYGLLIGPSGGYFYSKQGGRAFGGIAIRTLGATVSSLGVLSLAFSSFGETSRRDTNAAAAFAYGGLAVLGVSFLVDLARVRSKTEDKNKMQSIKPVAQILPIASPQSRQMGLRLFIRF